MATKPTRSKFTTLKQLCEQIPPYLVSKLARKHGVDKKARTFSPWSDNSTQVQACSTKTSEAKIIIRFIIFSRCGYIYSLN